MNPSNIARVVGSRSFRWIVLGGGIAIVLVLLLTVALRLLPGSGLRTQALSPLPEGEEPSPIPAEGGEEPSLIPSPEEGEPPSLSGSGGGVVTEVPGGEFDVSCGCVGDDCPQSGSVRRETGRVAGTLIAQVPANEGGGKREYTLRDPEPIFGVRGLCLANALLQQLYVTGPLVLTGGDPLSPQDVERVALQIIRAPESQWPPGPRAGSISVPTSSVPDVLRKVQKWPPEGVSVHPPQRVPDAREVKTDEDLTEMVYKPFARIIRSRNGAAVFVASPEYGYTLNGEQRPNSHAILIYLDPEGYLRVVSDGHVSYLTVVRGEKFCWEQLGTFNGRPAIFEGCARILQDYMTKAYELTPSQPPPPP